MALTDTLKKIDLFAGVNRDALAALASSARIKKLEVKESLFNEGMEGIYFYVLLSGSVRVFKTTMDGKESTIKIIYPGEFFAEAVLFGKKSYPATAVATEPSEIVCINRDSFLAMIASSGARDAFISAVFDKLRFLTDQLHYLNSHDVEDRFFMFLIKNFGRQYRYEISLSKKDIASAIGTIPETFSRLILRLTKMGIIAWKKNTLHIKEGFWDNDFFDE
jgi:CRP/FNR family transcriptional regulator, dissimilatory nitrate respiration regulator